MSLANMTVLVGENNVGKTSFLRSLDVALMNSRPTDDDLHVDPAGTRANEFVVDMKLVPASGEEFSDAVAVRLGTAVRIPSTGTNYVTLRSRGTRGQEGQAPLLEHRFVDGWECDRAAAAALTELDRVTRDQLKLISFFMLDARRDMVDEIRLRRSYWGRLLSDIGIPTADRATLEGKLAALGNEVVGKSAVLGTLRTELEAIKLALGTAVTSVALEPIPSRLDELARAVDVLLQGPGSAPLPLRLQGLGARSLAVVMVFQAFTQMRLGAGRDVTPLPIAAFEEPEAHLHPHPQRAMFSLIRDLPGQKIVSTHSPYVTQVADIFDIRSLTRSPAGLRSRQVRREMADGTPLFDAAGLEKARRFVQRNHGEILFARCVVLFEGDTEDGAVPEFARSRWAGDPTTHGVSVIQVGGVGNLKHIVPILEHLAIPWVVLTDGDVAGTQALSAVEAQIERSLTSTESFRFPAGQTFEQFLIGNGFEANVRAAVARVDGASALSDYRTANDGRAGRGGVTRDYQTAGWEARLLLDYCSSNMKSGLGGRAIAEEIVVAVSTGVQPSLPTPILQLLEQVEAIIGLTP